MSTHIVAMGGGGFSMSSNGAPTSLDRYIVDLADKSAPLVCFAPTASADNATYINRFLMAYSGLGVRTMVLTLWQGAAESVRRLPEADVVLVGGGNTANLMALWDVHGVSSVLRRMATENGRTTVLGGISAGAACWFEGCLTDAFGDLRGCEGRRGAEPAGLLGESRHLDGRRPRDGRDRPHLVVIINKGVENRLDVSSEGDKTGGRHFRQFFCIAGKIFQSGPCFLQTGL